MASTPFALLAAGFALLTASALSRNGWLARLRIPGARLFAVLSFSLYLTHKEAMHLLFHFFPNLPDATCRMQPLFLATCLAVAAALYLAVERPFLRLRNRSRNRHAQPLLAPQAVIDPAL